jgi:hypothetical protein
VFILVYVLTALAVTITLFCHSPRVKIEEAGKKTPEQEVERWI